MVMDTSTKELIQRWDEQIVQERKTSAEAFEEYGNILLNKGSRTGRVTLYITVNTTDEDVLYRLEHRYGGRVRLKALRVVHPTRHNSWTIASQQALRFLKQVLPYLDYWQEMAAIAIQIQNSKRAYPPFAEQERAREDHLVRMFDSIKYGSDPVRHNRKKHVRT